ncbi:hypothetical protein ACJMK2_000721 [Sinanodonta woodiana]|uniref:C1q domain-containing protein n=1 Tax=Sinanodonta woodiana TaxID=1069815 RepID=A0ABD3XQ86_SINWO
MTVVGTIIHLSAFFLYVKSAHATNNLYYPDENDMRMLMEKMMLMDRKINQLESNVKETKHNLRQCEGSIQREIFYLKTKIVRQERDMQTILKILSVKSNHKGNYSGTGAPEKEYINATGLSESSIIGHNVDKEHRYRFLEHPSGPVAFSTYTSQIISDFGLNQTIKYKGVLTNEGNAYNPHTGIFTCPSSGLYLISFFTSIHGISGAWVRLVVDDINVSDAVSRGFDPNGDDQGGNVAILRLTTGQSVWTEMQFVKNSTLSSTTEFRHVTFSGVRLSD